MTLCYRCLFVALSSLLLASTSVISPLQANQEIDPVVGFLRGQVQIINDTKKSVQEKTDALNRISGLADEVISRKLVSPKDPQSVLNAAIIFKTLNEASQIAMAQTKNGDETIERVGERFQAAKKGIEQGKISFEATAILKSGEIAMDELKSVLGNSRDLISKVEGNAKDFYANLKVQEVVLPLFDPTAARPTFLGIIGGYLPSGTLTQTTTQGYVMVLNYDDGPRVGVLEFEVKGGTITPQMTDLAIEAGQTEIVNFKLTVPEGGTIIYRPIIRRK